MGVFYFCCWSPFWVSDPVQSVTPFSSSESIRNLSPSSGGSGFLRQEVREGGIDALRNVIATSSAEAALKKSSRAIGLRWSEIVRCAFHVRTISRHYAVLCLTDKI